MIKRILIAISLLLTFSYIPKIKAVFTMPVDGLSGDFDFLPQYTTNDSGGAIPEELVRVYLVPKSLPTIESIEGSDYIAHRFVLNQYEGETFTNTLYYDQSFIGWRFVLEYWDGTKEKMTLQDTALKILVMKSKVHEQDAAAVHLNITIPGSGQEFDDEWLQLITQTFQIYLEKPGSTEALIEITQDTFTAYSDSKPTVEYILSRACVKDGDGNILDIPITTTYNPNILRTPQRYTFYYMATVNGQGITKPFYINYIDHLPPEVTINKTDIYLKKNTTPQDVLNIPDLLIIHDNIDTTFIKTVHDASFTIINEPGAVWVDIKVSDRSGNYTIVRINALVIMESPELRGPDKFIIDVKDFIDSRYIKSYYTATDYFGNNLTSQISIVKDTYSGKGSTPGTYQIRLQVKDMANNVTQKIVTIKVVKGLNDYFIVDRTIHVSNARKLTNEDFSYAFHVMLGAKQGTIYFTFHFSEYIDNYQTVGFESLTEVVGIDQRNSNIPTFYANLKVERSQIFGQIHSDNSLKTILTIIPLLIIIMAGYFIFRGVMKFKRKRKWY